MAGAQHAGGQKVIQGIHDKILVEERQAGSNVDQKYFLIQHKATAGAEWSRGLLLVLPGGTGGREFLPFCANVLTMHGVPTNFVVAQLVAPEWRKGDDDRVVWPSQAFPDTKARFNSEAFIGSVIKDVSGMVKIDSRWVFTLGWSSSGHALYSASVVCPEVRGSIIVMSRFVPGKFRDLERAGGKSITCFIRRKTACAPSGRRPGPRPCWRNTGRP